MRKSYQILSCAGLAALALALLGVKDYPAFSEMQLKAKELDQAKKQNSELLKKLDEKKRAQADHQTLEEQIQALRGSVPKSPNSTCSLSTWKSCANPAIWIWSASRISVPMPFCKERALKVPKERARADDIGIWTETPGGVAEA